MKRFAFLALVAILGLIFTSLPSDAAELTLFDSNGAAAAYVGEKLTIYLWTGEPVAYLNADSGGGFHIYGFNGKHLGWYVSGVVRDHEGHAVGARKEVFTTSTESEPFKAFKQFEPFKSFTEFAPFRPFLTNTWSQMFLDDFLKQGQR
jgi:hypothetical protein